MHPNNILTSSNGTTLLETSSSRGRSDASSILFSEKGVWVSEDSLPQSLTLRLPDLSLHPPMHFFGWYCWHSYSSNPSLVELQISSDSQSYNKWGQFQGQLSSKPQIFSLDPLPNGTKSIRIIVKETFGAANCYLNKVFLFDKLVNSKPYKKFDESMVNISDISSNSHEVQNVAMWEKNLKSKLRFQLDELHENLNFLKEKYDKPDEIEELKNEVLDCQGRMIEISQNLKELIGKVTKVQKNTKSFEKEKKFQSVKEEILQEIRRRKRKSLSMKEKEKEKSQKFNRVTDRFRDTKAEDILALIQLKTEEKMAKIRELEKEKRKIMSP